MTPFSPLMTDLTLDLRWSQAARGNDLTVVSAMLVDGWPVDRLLHESFPSWKTALSAAASHPDGRMGLHLLDAGATVDHRDGMGITPLMEACFFGSEVLVERLIDAGAVLDLQSATGFSPLHWAARQGHTAIVARLLAAGADPALRDQQGETPLMMAMSGPVVRHTAVADLFVAQEQAALRAVLAGQATPVEDAARPRVRL